MGFCIDLGWEPGKRDSDGKKCGFGGEALLFLLMCLLDLATWGVGVGGEWEGVAGALYTWD